MLKIEGVDALANRKANPRRNWNSTPSSSVLSANKSDASVRIFEGYADVRADYFGPRLAMADPVFAMGSCFAREIEDALIHLGGRVVSLDASIERPEFQDGHGQFRSGFFHRYTPPSMLQEFQQAFGELPGWTEESLVFWAHKHKAADFNYATVPGADSSLNAVITRRRVAAELVRQAATAKVIILTLGLIESWLHKPSGFYANAPSAQALAQQPQDFEMRLVDAQDTIDCLEGIHDLLTRRHATGDFRMVVTVSPVPMAATFTPKDIVVANAESKAVLRAAAGAFTGRHENVDYFPSYEMVTLSAPELAWRPDRLHVNGRMVRRVVRSFMKAYYDTEA
jgi:hypothetical protein